MPAVEYALDALFFSIREHDLLATIRSELGTLEALDGFAARDEERPSARAAPLGAVCILSSRTTIGVAIVPAIFALCAKCNVLVKDREDTLVAAFFETLAQELPEFTEAARAQVWSSQDAPAHDLSSFDGVVAFGNDATLQQLASSLSAHARFVGFGSRASAGYAAREALANERALQWLCEGAARDLVLYESEGCLCLHLLFLERGSIEPAHFCEELARAVERANIEFPPGRIDPAKRAQRAQARSLAAFRAASGSGAVFSDDACDYAVILDPPRDEPPTFLPRVLGVIPVDGPAQALQYLRAHRLPLEGFALAADRPDLVAMAQEAGAVRLARFGELQQPPLGGNHGGHPRIAEFVRWIDKAL